MRTLIALVAFSVGSALVGTGTARAQGRGGMDWTTAGNDAQRSSWVRTDVKISGDSMQKPGFQLLWKIKFNNNSTAVNPLTQAVLLDRYIGYRGFRSLAFLSDASDNIFAVDYDLGRVEWRKHLSGGAAQAASAECPGGMTSNVTRSTAYAIAPPPAGRGGAAFGRSGPAQSGVGSPMEGAVTLADAGAPRQAFAAAPAARPGAVPNAAAFRRAANVLYALSSDGMLHTMYVSNGEEPEPAMRFLPANAHAHGLIVVENIAYVATSSGCGGAANGVWALDLASRQVTIWKTNGAGALDSAGPAFGPDGTVYWTTGAGDSVHSVVALEPGSLKLKDWYTAKGVAFQSSPVLFRLADKTLLAAAGSDGEIHLLDSARLGGADHQTPLQKSAGSARALASWEDSAGTRWLLGSTTTAVVTWRVASDGRLQQAWTSREIASPHAPMIVNGVIFALGGGVARSTSALLCALDSATGKELWSSGQTISSSAGRGGLSGGGTQVYVGTNDGTLYGFGFPIEH